MKAKAKAKPKSKAAAKKVVTLKAKKPAGKKPAKIPVLRFLE